MNTTKNMIIANGKIKTKDIVSCNYNSQTHKYNIKFKDGSVYSYNYLNVEWLRDPEVLNPAMYHISRAGHEFFDIRAIYVFGGLRGKYWHICFNNGMETDYSQNELNIKRSCLLRNNANNVFEYLKQISELSDLKNEVTGEKLLSKKYEKIDYIDEKVALAQYLSPQKGNTENGKREYIPIFPFGCNKSQYDAVKRALENQTSVIQGPPGTGKTQTILNIIANILLEGKTVQIVSNNNSATENVYEKLSSPKYNLGFIVASLGKAENKKNFMEEQTGAYPDFSSWKMKETEKVTLEEIKAQSSQLKGFFDKQEELAVLKQELADVELEFQYFNEYLKETRDKVVNIKDRGILTADKCMKLWQECQLLSEKEKGIGSIFKIKSIFRYGIFDWKFWKQDISKIIIFFQELYYKKKCKELQSRIVLIEKALNSTDSHLLERMCSQSIIILKDILARKYSAKEKREIFKEEDLWKNPYRVLEEYPVILSTTFSSKNSLNKDVIYDYLIMDEASQVDIATGALSLSCAKNVVIVGDTKQLPNVVTDEIKQQSQAIFGSFHINAGYQFTKSFLQSILDVIPNVTQTLLREHYRCHPKIINFCNQKFYKGELIIMTEDKGEQDVLSVMKTAEGNHARDHYSQRQIDVIKKEIIPNFVEDKDETGIIAPYKNQVEALEQEFSDIDVATVHKFQGKEKDTIIISTVDDEITDFVDDPYLINVAVSRAKKKLMLVVSGNEQAPERNISDLISYIQYNNFEVKKSEIYSIFDYLYKQYTDARLKYLQSHKKISEFDSENLMYALIVDVLDQDTFASLNVACHISLNMILRNLELLEEKEREYASNPATHLDFVIFNRISKKPILAVEVDGYEYHQKGTKQSERDRMKDHILEVYRIPLLRFKTNGSGEQEILVEKLNELMEKI